MSLKPNPITITLLKPLCHHQDNSTLPNYKNKKKLKITNQNKHIITVWQVFSKNLSWLVLLRGGFLRFPGQRCTTPREVRLYILLWVTRVGWESKINSQRVIARARERDFSSREKVMVSYSKCKNLFWLRCILVYWANSRSKNWYLRPCCDGFLPTRLQDSGEKLFNLDLTFK